MIQIKIGAILNAFISELPVQLTLFIYKFLATPSIHTTN